MNVLWRQWMNTKAHYWGTTFFLVTNHKHKRTIRNPHCTGKEENKNTKHRANIILKTQWIINFWVLNCNLPKAKYQDSVDLIYKDVMLKKGKKKCKEVSIQSWSMQKHKSQWIVQETYLRPTSSSGSNLNDHNRTLSSLLDAI